MPTDVTCVVCGANSKAAGAELQKPCSTCAESWCLNCVLNRCTLATKSLGEMPPRCCRMFNPRVVLKALPEAQQQRYKDLFDEYRTEIKERYYCPNRGCGAFISPYKIAKQRQGTRTSMERSLTVSELGDANHKRHDSGLTTPNIHQVDCDKCNTTVCLTCKQEAHAGKPCHFEDDPIIAQIQKFGYKRCPRCGFGTRRMFGCNHMQCVCGAHWCWSCERNFAVCDAIGGCGEDDEEDEDPSDIDEDMSDPAADEDEILEDSADLRAEAPVVASAANTEEVQPLTANDANTTQPQPPEPVRERRRSINLDRGSHAYWEGEGLDFGAEPESYEGEESWGCTHEFNKLSKKEEDALGKEVCWECWTVIDEQSARCWLCHLVRCEDCMELFGDGGA